MAFPAPQNANSNIRTIGLREGIQRSETTSRKMHLTLAHQYFYANHDV